MQTTLFCNLPPTPEWKNEWYDSSFDSLSNEDKAALGGVVTDLVIGEDTLWGYNAYSGMLGMITEKGIVWNEKKLDVTYYFTGESTFLRAIPMLAFIEDGKLYMFMEKDSGLKPMNETTVLLRFELTDGKYDILETNNAITCCRYQSGFLLLLRRASTSSVSISIMDITTGMIEDLSIPLPFEDGSLEGRASVGGLAYEPENDQIYLSAQSQVWKTKVDALPTAVAYIPSEIFYDMPAWILSDGRYAVFARSLYIRNVN